MQLNGSVMREMPTRMGLDLDDETMERLLRLSLVRGKPPRAVASELLGDLLLEDDLFNGAGADPGRRLHS